MTREEKYITTVKQILNAANKVKYLWDTPEALEDGEFIFTRIITTGKEKVYLGIKKNEERALSFFYRIDNRKEETLPMQQFAETICSRYPLVKLEYLKQDFLTKVALPLKKYEILIADARGKARKKLEALEAILS